MKRYRVYTALYGVVFVISACVLLFNNKWLSAVLIVLSVGIGICQLAEAVKKQAGSGAEEVGRSGADGAANSFANDQRDDFIGLVTDHDLTLHEQDTYYSRSILFSKIIDNRLPADEMAAELTKNGFRFEFDTFQTAIILIEDINQQFKPDEYSIEDVDDTYGAVRLLTDNLEPLLAEYGIIAYFFAYDGNNVAVFNYPSDGNEVLAEKRCREVWNTIADKLYSGYGIVSTVCISLTGHGIDEISELYKLLKPLSEHVRIMEYEDQVISLFKMQYSKYYITESREPNYLDMKKRFITYMQTRNYSEAKETMNSMITVFKEENDMESAPVDRTKYRLYGLIDLMLGAVESFRLDVDKQFFSSLFPATDFKYCRSYSELYTKVNIIFVKLIEYYDNKNRNQPPQWCSSVKKYIEENLDNPLLNIGMVATALGLNPAYASRVFRIYEGMGILDYIHRRRVEQAKVFLSQGVTVSDTAEKVGFGNSRAMNRAFVKFEGVTPGNLRKI